MTRASIHTETHLGAVHLITADLQRALRFYQSVLGMDVREQHGTTAFLSAGGQRDLLVLTENPAAIRYEGTTGLYHFGLKLPSRYALSRSYRRIVDLDWPLHGAADHLVCQAIYLRDPDGNLLQLYNDRPDYLWGYSDGRLLMDSLPFSLSGLLETLHGQDGTLWHGIAEDTTVGHVDLRVRNVAESDTFYMDVLGFDYATRSGSLAGFVSAGEYYYHIGYNVWASQPAPAAPPDALGLRYFEVLLPNKAELKRIAARVRAANLPLEETPDGWLTRDPADNGVMLRIASS